MKKFILIVFLLCFFHTIGFAQKIQPPVKTAPVKSAPTTVVTEISGAQWKALTDALQAEDWKNGALLTAQYLEKLKIENDKKQLAQLRYFHLYALAGRILDAYSSKIPVEKTSIWRELESVVSSFTGKEFVMPPRQFLSECREVLNYICTVKNNERALRVTATNKEGTSIHAFEYVLFDQKIELDRLGSSESFLGGRLKSVEFNQDMTKPWVMRLIFDKGFVRTVGADIK